MTHALICDTYLLFIQLEDFMAVSARVETLESKHSTLEGKIQQELRHPIPDQARLAKLKKEKLQIKDELTSLVKAVD